MLGSFRHHRLLQRLACLAVLLMLVAPLISRWIQMPAQEPMCTSGVSASIDTASLAPGQFASHQHASHQHASHHAGHAAATTPHAGDHAAASHGEACDYCVLAARLLPWLIVAVLCLLQLRPSPISAASAAPHRAALRWAALGARGPPRQA
ncbi:DUF2946 family protein [Xanthomonas melonis]|uniref:DUF2946 family protein n=1 Tax=Xanthomonas melonis TaxID=56456 RepID=UPI003EBAF2CA